ncbi:hypothetical protein CHLRE_04g217965v5 [Chlamydomonas reinhardtii]|uniref:Uncharacterized protein n=1 Tax=Chlamydomonas reinhardtii TaxID=3055 RepID=A0A2K3DTL6_CHLRE|nr:uncharacterized protein CHLRE_04g217965v5 [Chlamydomonas reinhardtii]PNW83867.1 hypothetical protein CHLRE_04g217965v5 [Chlamydomonas reinhardtii]
MYSSTSPTGLFRVQPICTASQQQLLAAIDRKVPVDLHAAAEGSGDGALSDAELMAALAGSANDAHDGGEMAAALPASWREGIITLIYKGKSLDRAELAGGVNHVDLPAFLSALQAKTFALLAQPGRQTWKMLIRALLTHVRPDSATTIHRSAGRAGAPEGLGGVDCCQRSSREVGQVQAKVYCQGADPVSSQREVAPRLRRLEVEEAARNYA